MLSLNNRLVLEQYIKKELRAETTGGFARMAHKISLQPLKILVDAKLADGTVVPAGSIAFVREEYLHNANGRGTTLPTFENAEISDKPFIVIDIVNVDIVDIVEKTC